MGIKESTLLVFMWSGSLDVITPSNFIHIHVKSQLRHTISGTYIQGFCQLSISHGCLHILCKQQSLLTYILGRRAHNIYEIRNEPQVLSVAVVAGPGFNLITMYYIICTWEDQMMGNSRKVYSCIIITDILTNMQEHAHTIWLAIYMQQLSNMGQH